MRPQCLLGRTKLLSLIAHREPILYVERVVRNEVGRLLIAESTTNVADCRLRQLEALGQAAALLIRQTPEYAGHQLPVFAAMRNVNWRPVAADAAHLQLSVEFSKTKRSRAKFGFVDATASIPEGGRVCEAAVVSEGSQGGLARQLRSEIERLAGSERGLFMASESIRAELDGHIRALESAVSPSFSPTDNKASLVDGNWRLLYTTLTILGRKRVRLAIATSQKPGFVRIGDITQSIDPVSSTSRSAVNFEVLAGGFKGYFEIIAGYEAVDPKRVEVKLQEWNLVPAKMAEILGEKKVGLLLQIFNPEGYLDITYADEDIRVGRDHNGNVFVLEKVTEV